MTKEQKAENARLRTSGRIPAETLSYLASVKNKRRKVIAFPYRTGLAGYFMADVIALYAMGFVPIKAARWLVAVAALFFIVQVFSFLSECVLKKKLLFGWRAKTTT